MRRNPFLPLILTAALIPPLYHNAITVATIRHLKNNDIVPSKNDPETNEPVVKATQESLIKEPTEEEIAWAYKDYMQSRLVLEGPTSFSLLTFEQCLNDPNLMTPKNKKVLQYIMEKRHGDKNFPPEKDSIYFRGVLDHLENTNPNSPVFRIMEKNDTLVR